MEQKTTQLGTPWAHTWDDAWAVRVEQRETELGRRICGAKTLAGNPCTIVSRHKTGRCPFHGGTDAIGAPAGNANARVHGLYARRLQRCGTHCAMWQHCPFAGPEVLQLDPPERPVCAYESAEYAAVLQELEGGSDHDITDTLDPRLRGDDDLGAGVLETRLRGNDGGVIDRLMQEQIRDNPQNPRAFSNHNLALLQVMVSRAAAALSVLPLTDDVTSESDNYRLQSTKVHAALEAFLRLTREHRATLAQHQRDLERQRKAEAESADRPLSLADIAAPLIEQGEGVMEEAIQAQNETNAYIDQLEALAAHQLGPHWRTHLTNESGTDDNARSP